MQSQSQNGPPAAAPNAEAISRKAAPQTAPANDVGTSGNAAVGAADGAQNGVPADTAPVTPDDSPHQRQARIAAEAYRIAEERGFPANSAVDHWYEAQRRLGYSGLDLAASSNGSASERM
jgi:hypothetical protein